MGSPPPPTFAGLVSVPVVPALMPGVKLKMLLPAAAMAVALVQVMFCPAAIQLQLAAWAPPRDRARRDGHARRQHVDHGDGAARGYVAAVADGEV
ncbi:MAG: hypothetical protein IPP88_23870 [Betaproteobacteria bacterium]|nr:hypothetical protein [Betaproteobacteria bacterium]